MLRLQSEEIMPMDSPALSERSRGSFEDDMSDEDLDAYFASYVPLSNLPTPPTRLDDLNIVSTKPTVEDAIHTSDLAGRYMFPLGSSGTARVKTSLFDFRYPSRYAGRQPLGIVCECCPCGRVSRVAFQLCSLVYASSDIIILQLLVTSSTQSDIELKGLLLISPTSSLPMPGGIAPRSPRFMTFFSALNYHLKPSGLQSVSLTP